MIRKGIYLRFLLIGVLSLNSCPGGDVDYFYASKYYYINQSNRSIQMMIYNSSDELFGDLEIVDGDTLSFTLILYMVPPQVILSM